MNPLQRDAKSFEKANPYLLSWSDVVTCWFQFPARKVSPLSNIYSKKKFACL